jgi:hypothetical protein
MDAATGTAALQVESPAFCQLLLALKLSLLLVAPARMVWVALLVGVAAPAELTHLATTVVRVATQPITVALAVAVAVALHQLYVLHLATSLLRALVQVPVEITASTQRLRKMAKLLVTHLLQLRVVMADRLRLLMEVAPVAVAAALAVVLVE